MSDSQNPQQDPHDSQQPTHDLMEELRKLGQQLEQTARAGIENERVRSFQQDVSSGMQEFFAQMQQAVGKLQDDPRVQNMTERGQQAVHQVQERAQDNQAIKDLQATMARGVAYFSEQLNEFSQRLAAQQEQDKASGGDGSGSGPTTGPTVRLDIEEDDQKK